MTCLTSPAQLADAIATEPPPLVCDVRWALTGSDPDGYRREHLPGAVFLDLDEELAAAPGAAGRHPLPSPAQFGVTLTRLGATPDRQVVLYDAGHGMAAARAWWCLRYFGHQPDRVRILDGGLAAWLAAGLPTESGDVAPAQASAPVVATPGGMPVFEATRQAHDGVVLLDARAAPRFRGETEPIDPVAGHVPGAVNLPFTEVQHDDGRYRDRAEITAAVQAALGTTPQAAGTLVAYCGSGVSAAVLLVALDRIGVPAALYPGSWSEWISDPTRAIATGPAS